ncbi:MAG: lysyl oxidase family protein [Gaiellaceae bacterium MAG52_C11]|nr:lysyl oxidase family protein [Candidatus Gaiellasilicea maunaloa]
MRRTPPGVVALVFALGLVATVALGLAFAPGEARPGRAPVASLGWPATAELLPDLDQEAPSKLVVTEVTRAGRRVVRLGFASAVTNVGAGPLLVDGSRRSLSAGPMRADQLVRRVDGSTVTVRGVAMLRYVRSADHAHWHLVPFELYELRRVGASGPPVRDGKTGFCLGDRYDANRDLAGKPPEEVFRGRCGLRSPHLLAVRQGISVGYGDDYDPNLEGQFVELTGLPAGRYVLVHRVNGDRRLRESDYSNNAASLLLELRWNGRTPVLTTLRICPASARCPSLG